MENNISRTVNSCKLVEMISIILYMLDWVRFIQYSLYIEIPHTHQFMYQEIL